MKKPKFKAGDKVRLKKGRDKKMHVVTGIYYGDITKFFIDNGNIGYVEDDLENWEEK